MAEVRNLKIVLSNLDQAFAASLAVLSQTSDEEKELFDPAELKRIYADFVDWFSKLDHEHDLYGLDDHEEDKMNEYYRSLLE